MELAELFREYKSSFEQKYVSRLSSRHRKAIDSIIKCRTPAAGEMIVSCPKCGKIEYHPHSCGNRSCPKCQHHETSVWLERQLVKLLPVPYFLVTFTIPAILRAIVWRNQKIAYKAMFQAAVHALRELGKNERFMGGTIGMTGVLHTTSRRLEFHPHLHFIVPAGAIDFKNHFWKRKRWKFLFPEKSLAKLFRNAFLASLESQGIQVPKEARSKGWVVKCIDSGSGEPALKYLSRYLYRGTISEKRIIASENGKVTFRYKEGSSKTWKTRTLPGEDFLWLIIQHVLPSGFQRSRNFGFLHGNARKILTLVQLLLNAKIPLRIPKPRPAFSCKGCGSEMKIVACRIRRGEINSRAPP